jgi:hypothetical protein
MLSIENGVGRSGRRSAIVAVAGLVVALAPAVWLATAEEAAATTPDGVSFTLEGCRNDGTITLPDGGGTYICPDGAYTSGNLGKGWNELDLVPYRLTGHAGNSAPAAQTYTVAIAVDKMDVGHPGYDVLSVPVLNTSLSDATCTAPVVGPETTLSPGLGGIDQTLYRLVTITQPKSSTCVYDYYARLALGSHLFPGSSLHANLANESLGTAGIGSKDVSIPVKEILPQELSKDMTASQDSDHIWNIVKEPTPATLSFPNTCDPSGLLSNTVSIKVTWTKQPASPSGNITVITHVYAENPAARTITVNVTDVVYAGATPVDTSSSGPVDVPANTEQLVLTHTTTVPAGTTDLNDVATATYIDKVTGVPVPGTTTATASATVQPSGIEKNQTATITDVESITGSGLAFAVDSVTGAAGSFAGSYTLGAVTTEPVSWTSNTQSDSGSVTFGKTVYATAASVMTGSLDDTATLNGSDGFTAQASASVNVSTNASTYLQVSKTTQLKIASAQSFTFHLYDGSNTATGDTATVTMPANSNGPVTSNAISGLSPTGTYYFKEDATAPYAEQTTNPVTFSLVPGDIASCSAVIDVANEAAPATAQVRKVTSPSSSGLWTFTLTGPGGINEPLDVQAGSGYAAFTSVLDTDGGTYTITETPKSGYDLTNIVGDVGGNAGRVATDQNALTCSFTLDLTSDSAKVFECTFTNTQRGHIIVRKVTDPSGSSQAFEFTPSYGANFALTDGQSNDSGLLVPGSYSVAELATAGWDLTSSTCDNGDSPSSITLQPGATVTCTFENTQRGAIIVKKVTDPTGAAGTFTFSGDASGTIADGGAIVVSNLVPGTYTSTEANPAPAFDLTSIVCDDGSSATPSSGSVATRAASFKVDPGETVTCTFTNRQRGHASVLKTVEGAAPSGTQSFTFQLRQGASALSAGTILETRTANAANGGQINFTTDLVPGAFYQLCEQTMPGWMTSLGPPFFVVFNPSGDNSVVCTEFTVAAGETKAFAIDNTPPPGGRALTIGFWKNWASCSGSNGKQKPVLDQTLLAAAQAGHPIQIGSRSLDPTVYGAGTVCKWAVNLLSKRTVTTGVKKASDPLFNLAAQLLAAKLNVAAGAGVCPAAVTAINQAQTLLVDNAFNGVTHGYLTPFEVTKANNLAHTLDLYNNNLLC